MTYLLFENPKYLLLFLGIVDLILIFSLKKIPFNKKKIAIIIIAILIPTIHILAKVIVTDKEKIENSLIKISQNANKLQIDSVTPILDDNFNGEFKKKNYNKEDFIKLLKEKVDNKVINAINFKIKKIKFSKNSADSIIISFVDLTTSDGVFRLPLEWKMKWNKKGDSWYIIRTESPTMIKL